MTQYEFGILMQRLAREYVRWCISKETARPTTTDLEYEVDSFVKAIRGDHGEKAQKMLHAEVTKHVEFLKESIAEERWTTEPEEF
jgi:hypothetical protein